MDINQTVVAKSNARLIGEISGSAGVAGVGLTFELELGCMTAAGKDSIGAGPYRYEVATDGSDTHKLGHQPEWVEEAVNGILDRKEMKIGKVKVGVEGKLVLKGCKRMLLPF